MIIIYILPPVETIRFCVVRVLCNCSEVVNFSLLMVPMHRMGIHYSVTFSIRVHYVLTNSPSLLALLLLFYHKFPMNIYHTYHRKFLFCINLEQPTFRKSYIYVDVLAVDIIKKHKYDCSSVIFYISHKNISYYFCLFSYILNTSNESFRQMECASMLHKMLLCVVNAQS